MVRASVFPFGKRRGYVDGSSGSQICLAWSLPCRRDGNGGPQTHIKDSDIVRVSITFSLAGRLHFKSVTGIRFALRFFKPAHTVPLNSATGSSSGERDEGCPCPNFRSQPMLSKGWRRDGSYLVLKGNPCLVLQGLGILKTTISVHL